MQDDLKRIKPKKKQAREKSEENFVMRVRRWGKTD
jgi:hypothetical protein